MDNISNKKKQIRKDILEVRRSMDIDKKDTYDTLIEKSFFESSFYKEAKIQFKRREI